MEPNAILAISSTDRYTRVQGGQVDQPIANTLFAQYETVLPFANDFSISPPGALLNGYIDKIILSQIQIQYNLPTVIPGSNNLLIFYIEQGAGTSVFLPYPVTIPYGFYSPLELSITLETEVNQVIPINLNTSFIIDYNNANTYEFINTTNLRFYFETPVGLADDGFSQVQIIQSLKTYKLFGLNINNAASGLTQRSWNPPQFLYTPYFDFYSDALTNYQRVKDTDSSIASRKGLIARVYLSGESNPQTTPAFNSVATSELNFTFNGLPGTGTMTTTTPFTDALGSSPFILTYALASPKVIRWTPDVAINSLDFQVRDCYGDLLFSGITGQQNIESFNSEFQITLLCIERD